jgi:hypothetical protein
MALGSTQPLKEMSTRNLPGRNGRPAREADNLTDICEIHWLESVRASTFHTLLHGLLQGQLYILLIIIIIIIIITIIIKHQYMSLMNSLRKPKPHPRRHTLSYKCQITDSSNQLYEQ